MTLNESETAASLVLREADCCPRCVIRFLYGASETCQADVINASEGIREKPLCPACCGLLHHPSLCQLSVNFGDIPSSSQLLATIVRKIQSSPFEYSACILKTVTPVNIILREHIVWTVLLQKTKATEDDSHQATSPQTDLSSRFSNNDVEKWRRSSISLKVAWQWVIEPILSSAIKVPFIQSPNDIPEYILEQLGSTPFPETSILTVEAELTNENSSIECESHLQTMKPTVSREVQARIDALLNTRPIKNRRRRATVLQKTVDVDNAVKPEELPLCQFSKTNLQPVLSLIFDQKVPHPYSFPKMTSLPAITKVRLGRDCPTVVAGRYVKLDRYLPQTPWIIGNKRKLSSSVEELIVDPIKEHFGRNCTITFSSSGREDVDVRCLGLGRPFILQIENYECSVQKLISKFSKFADTDSHAQCEIQTSVDLLHLATLINSQTDGRLFVRDVQIVPSADAAHAIKNGELEKSKCYRAVCWCGEGGLTTELVQSLAKQCCLLNPNGLPCESDVSSYSWPPTAVEEPIGFLEYGPITICQLTPIRVLHRRAALERVRNVRLLRLADYRAVMRTANPDFIDYEHWANLYPVEELFVVELRCDAGTYVKEFVHGDLGRSRPSLVSLFGRPVDILTLDVVAVELDWPTRLPDPDLPSCLSC